MQEELTLIVAAKKGDKEAFLSLIEPLEHRLYQTALGIVGNKFDAEDAWQNTVLQAWRGVKGLREPFFKTWITRILLNESKQILRKRGKLPQLFCGSMEREAQEYDISGKLLALSCLRRLPSEQREAVILRYWLDLTLEEMAQTLHVPLSTAKTRLYQGLATLRQEMKEVDLHD